MIVDVSFVSYLKQVSEIDTKLINDLIREDHDVTSKQVEHAKLEVDRQRIIAQVLMKSINRVDDPILFAKSDIADLARKSGIEVPELEK